MKTLTSAALTAARCVTCFVVGSLSTATLAQDASGDAAAGETQFNRQCVSCHVVATPAGAVLAGRNARTGPNLYEIPGGSLGAVGDFRQYSDGLRSLGEQGKRWDEAAFVAYVQDPTGWIRAQTGDRRARGRMAYQVRDAGDARDIWAYLVSLQQ